LCEWKDDFLWYMSDWRPAAHWVTRKCKMCNKRVEEKEIYHYCR